MTEIVGFAVAPSRTWTRWPFRLAMTLAAMLVFDQPVFAGEFLAGSYPALQLHRENATYTGIAMLVAAGTAVLLRWPGHGPWWPMIACVGLFGMIAAQIILGFARLLTIHVPLGVLIIVLTIGLTTWAWRPRRPATRPGELS